jgi:hypothetical protein
MTCVRPWPAPDTKRAGDEALYARLRQHFWEPSKAESGHKGGHYGTDSPGHMRSVILPLLLAEGS